MTTGRINQVTEEKHYTFLLQNLSFPIGKKKTLLSLSFQIWDSKIEKESKTVSFLQKGKDLSFYPNKTDPQEYGQQIQMKRKKKNLFFLLFNGVFSLNRLSCVYDFLFNY
jgi:hypothetical protein